MRKLIKMKTGGRRGPSPGQTFATWIHSNAVELNVRKVAKEFAEWIDSGEREFDSHSGLKKRFLELTQLTVDLTRELRQIRGPFGGVRFVGQAAYVSHSRGDQQRFATIRRYRGKINPILLRI